MSDAVIVRVDTGVADVRINRPDKRNAVDGDVMNGLLDVIEQIAGDNSVRAVVLSGEGLIAESDCSRALMGTANQLEAIMSGFEGREPQFIDPTQARKV